MIGKLLRAVPRPRRMVAHLAIIVVLPVVALAYWPAPPSGNAGAEAPPKPATTGTGTNPHVDTSPVPTPGPVSQNHPSPVTLRNTARRPPARGGDPAFRRRPRQRCRPPQPDRPDRPDRVARPNRDCAAADADASQGQCPGLDAGDVVGHGDSPQAELNGLFGKPVSCATKPEPSDVQLARNWEVKSLDLVGLLMHDRPVVYVSEKLEMSKLKAAPTRKLDSFEVSALAQLQAGKELFAQPGGNGPAARSSPRRGTVSFVPQCQGRKAARSIFLYPAPQ